jgi:hypothetical protein
MNLVEFSDLKSLLELERDALTDYPALEVLVDSTKAAIEEHLGREIDYGRRTETIPFYEPGSMLPLKALPVKELVSVTLTPWGSSSSQTVTSAYPTPYGARLSGEVTGAVTVIYKGGLTSVPNWLRRAALVQVAYEFQNKDHIGADLVSIEGGSVSRPALSLLTEVKRMLAAHRHPSVFN